MAVGTTTMAVISAVTAIASAAMGTYSAVQQAETQKQQAEYQSDMAAYNAKVAEQQAQMAEYEGAELKRAAHEEGVKKRQEAAQIVGSQRAKQAASGVAVDAGSALDLNLDTTEKGELDALQLQDQGLWQDYNKRIDAWNYRNQAAVSQSKSSMYSQKAQQYTPLLDGADSLLSGVKKVGSSLGKLY